MGLDVVELVVRVEEEFGIAIGDEEASYISTVGQLHTLILDKTGALKPSGCASSATFYQLRRALVDLAVAPRNQIAPATSIAALLPAPKRRQLWDEWGEIARVKLPELEKPRWVSALCWLSFAATVTGGAVVLTRSNWGIASYYAAVWTIGFVAYKWSELRATQLPANCASIGALTATVMKLNYGTNAGDAAPGADEVWNRLKAIVVDETGARPDEVTPNADFIRDLNMG